MLKGVLLKYAFSVYYCTESKHLKKGRNTNSDDKIRPFLKTLHDLLRKHSILELENAIKRGLSENKEFDDIVLVIKEVSVEYRVPKKAILTMPRRGVVKNAMDSVCIILNRDNKMSFRTIAIEVFGRNHHNFVQAAIRRFDMLNLNKNSDKDFNEKIENIRARVKSAISEESKTPNQ